MPTFKENVHLGNKVPLVETDDISDKAITPPKIDESIVGAF